MTKRLWRPEDGGGGILVEGAGFVLLGQQADQIAQGVMAIRQAVKRLAGQKLLSDLAFELDAVTAMRGHGLPSFESPALGSIRQPDLSGPRGPLHYPGASSLGSDARRVLKDHPTVKLVAMLQDALLDLTNRGDVVLDPFLGSGSTLIAADKTRRVCRGIELDPLYVDVIIRRWEAVSGAQATRISTGEAFEELVAEASD